MNEERRQKELEQQKTLTQKLVTFLQGDENAVRFCIDLVFLLHLWDDLIDKDTHREDNEINDAFRVALVDIPSNPFYIAYAHHLRPLFMNVILQWHCANKLERGIEHEKHIAFGIRAAFIQLFVYCAYLIGGSQWAEKVGPDIWKMYEEKMEEFIASVTI